MGLALTRHKVAFGLAVLAAFVFVVSGLVVFGLRPGDGTLERGGDAAPDFGIKYLPITPRVSAYYGLGVDSGALVTEVTSNSPADRAGLRVGDIILSFNGARLDESVTLVGMMMSCPQGNSIELEVYRDGGLDAIELLYTTN